MAHELGHSLLTLERSHQAKIKPEVHQGTHKGTSKMPGSFKSTTPFGFWPFLLFRFAFRKLLTPTCFSFAGG
jgi:hypothetical protein